MVPDKGDTVFEYLGSIPFLGNCCLAGAHRHDIQDCYFEYGNGLLGRLGIALRVRHQDGKYLLAVKADEDISDDGLARRFEWERAWQPAAIDELLFVLVKLGMEPLETEPQYNPDPLVSLGKVFTILQQRKTARITRAVTCADDEYPMELALDLTTYRLQKQQLDHYEIELEISEQDLESAKGIIAAIKEIYPFIVPWKHNKLVTGLTLYQMYAQYPVIRDKNAGSLNADAYQQLDLKINTWKQ